MYKNQGRMKEVERMYLQTLTEYEKIWTLDHISALDIVNNLETLYADQNKMNEAEEMYLFCDWRSVFSLC